ncbi:hypothetical protein PPL_06706 [Heterostelium album PN500]|uniref:Uncharacterized protein n=1 Tax=Heterostelium pallidum (strain ATCC 26659 / Pp 5 / PN500) TaxID=670386 RepID=D3BFH2_HETP5|nr:hypothetical protein PPL_06706 [Heterostelium album PN500]EFA79886.1 hypothetical protein PPL_06706 [Heterostelium album PN500]|eukprot:XP_020432007.1 hypothetical protein PPL_06706 [Heterostelium album PN500]
MSSFQSIRARIHVHKKKKNENQHNPTELDDAERELEELFEKYKKEIAFEGLNQKIGSEHFFKFYKEIIPAYIDTFSQLLNQLEAYLFKVLGFLVAETFNTLTPLDLLTPPKGDTNTHLTYIIVKKHKDIANYSDLFEDTKYNCVYNTLRTIQVIYNELIIIYHYFIRNLSSYEEIFASVKT